MARTKAPPPPPPPEVFTELIASAHRIDLSDAREARRQQLRKTRPWQQQAWEGYDQIGEVWEAHNYVGNAMARVRLYPAVQENPAEPPVALDPEPDDGTAPDPRAVPAVEELARIRSNVGGQPQILSDYALNLGVSGECYLVGRVVDGDQEGEQVDDWGVFSTDQIKVDGLNWKIVNGPGDTEGEPLDPETTVLTRLWQRHPRFKNDPDSAMRAVLGVCEELLILTQKIRGQALSALNNGLLLIDDTMVPGGTDKTKFIEDIIAGITAPITDPDSPFAIAPNIITATGGEAGLEKRIMHLNFERAVDETDIKRREELLGRLANGLDLPREVILGLSSSPFSRTAWQIDEQTAKAHIEPKAVILCSSLTSSIVRPALRERGVQGWEDVVVWYDLGDIVGQPNESEEAKWAHERRLISDSRARRAIGFGDDDAPDDEEYGRRVEEERTLRQPGVNGTRAIESNGNGNGASVRPVLALAPIALTASARDRTIAGLGERLSDMDRMLRGQLQAAADAAMTSALKRAGARLRQRVSKNGLRAQFHGMLDGVDNVYVVSTLGPQVVTAAGFTDDDLLAESFEELHPRWDAWVLRTQKRAAGMARDLDAEIDEPSLSLRQHNDREDGWTVLLSALLLLARERLYDPDPVAPAVGEFQAGTRVPAGIVRGAMARAGGAQGAITTGGAALDSAGQPLGELATGPVVLDLLERAGVQVAMRTWVHGDADRPFEPHDALDGQDFTGWDDPVLTNDEGWPEVDAFFPGDHLGCSCVAELSLESNAEES